MKKINLIFAIVAIFATSLLTSCMESIEAGYVGIKVEKYGSDKGVQKEVLGVGRYWVGWNTDIYTYPTFQINYVFTREANEGSSDNEEFTFQTQEGMECSVDLGVAAHFEPTKIPLMFQVYRKGPDEIRSVVIRNAIRDNLNKIAGALPIETVYGAGKGKLIDTVKFAARKSLEANGIIIDNIYLIGSVRIPPSVKSALDAKVTATQDAMKVENKIREADAKAKIKVIEAEATAKAMDVVGDAIKRNPSILQSKAIDRWDGHYPTYYGGGAAGGIPLISIGK